MPVPTTPIFLFIVIPECMGKTGSCEHGCLECDGIMGELCHLSVPDLQLQLMQLAASVGMLHVETGERKKYHGPGWRHAQAALKWEPSPTETHECPTVSSDVG
jgi:hypothetical protein